MSLETEQILKLEEFTKKAVFEIGRTVKENCEQKLLTEVSKGTEIDVFGDYGYKFPLILNYNGAEITADITIHFTHIGATKSDCGFFIEILSSNPNATNMIDYEWKEGLLRGKGEFKDFIDVLENLHPVEFCESIIAKFCENIKQDFADSSVA